MGVPPDLLWVAEPAAVRMTFAKGDASRIASRHPYTPPRAWNTWSTLWGLVPIPDLLGVMAAWSGGWGAAAAGGEGPGQLRPVPGHAHSQPQRPLCCRLRCAP